MAKDQPAIISFDAKSVKKANKTTLVDDEFYIRFKWEQDRFLEALNSKDYDSAMAIRTTVSTQPSRKLQTRLRKCR